jgi:hypothetical protein
MSTFGVLHACIIVLLVICQQGGGTCVQTWKKRTVQNILSYRRGYFRTNQRNSVGLPARTYNALHNHQCLKPTCKSQEIRVHLTIHAGTHASYVLSTCCSSTCQHIEPLIWPASLLHHCTISQPKYQTFERLASLKIYSVHNYRYARYSLHATL